MNQPRVTISLPCYGRPQRTVRAIESILKQTVQDFELLITCDGDKKLFAHLLRTNFLFGGYEYSAVHNVAVDCKSKFRMLIECPDEHTGYWGYDIRNKHIQAATGKYFIFMGSDDVLLSTHLENYLSVIENTDLDFAYFDSYIAPHKRKRLSKLEFGHIGHSELIVRTEFLKQMPPHEPKYGHDWKLIQNMMAATDKHKKAEGKPATYHVMSVPGNVEEGID